MATHPFPQTKMSGEPTADATLSVPSGLDSVVLARHWVGAELGGVVPAAAVNDLQLAVSELVTNAVQHGDGRSVRLTLCVHPDRLTVAVASGLGARRPPPVQEWGSAPQSALGGRGLGIVKSVSDRVAMTEQGRRLTVVVEHSLAPPGNPPGCQAGNMLA